MTKYERDSNERGLLNLKIDRLTAENKRLTEKLNSQTLHEKRSTETLLWTIQILDDSVNNIHRGFHVYFDGNLGFTIDRTEAADCSELMKVIGDRIDEDGFPV